MKRIISILLISVLLLTSFSGCAGQPADWLLEPANAVGRRHGAFSAGTTGIFSGQRGNTFFHLIRLPSQAESSSGTDTSSRTSEGSKMSSQAAGSSSQSQTMGQSGASQAGPGSSQSSSSQSSSSQAGESSGTGSYTGDEYRAVWFSYLDLSGMLKGQGQSAFRKNIRTAFQNVSNLGCNVVIVQVRPFGDALYDSDYFPCLIGALAPRGKAPAIPIAGYGYLKSSRSGAGDRSLGEPLPDSNSRQ